MVIITELHSTEPDDEKAPQNDGSQNEGGQNKEPQNEEPQNNGPPHRNISKKSAAEITEAILQATAPTYYIARRAWSILGYHRQDKPSVSDFVCQINALWRHQAACRTLRARRARAYVLDALRTLGFRSPRWNVNLRELGMRTGDQDGSWKKLPSPRDGPVGRPDARQYLAAPAPSAASTEGEEKQLVDNQLWEDFHRYQGFRVKDVGGREHNLRAIPVPRGADSMWHAISYWIYQRRQAAGGGPAGEGGRSIWHYWQVKARIWTYFMQVLKEPGHKRWPDYHMLQRKSTSVDPDFGTLSMARSLYASQQQGKPAYPHHYLLYIVADYFDTEVVLFTLESTTTSQDQSEAVYSYTVYGHRDRWRDHEHPQILLITNRTKTHYDPVDFDTTPLHLTPGWSTTTTTSTSPTAPPSTPPPAFQTVTPGEIAYDPTGPHQRQRSQTPDDQPPPPCPWWPTPRCPSLLSETWNIRWWGSPEIPPYQQARYNHITEAERAAFKRIFWRADVGGPIPPGCTAPRPTLEFAPANLRGLLAYWRPWFGPRGFCEVVLVPEVWEQFRAGVDVPGQGFAVPSEGVLVEGWGSGEDTGEGGEDREKVRKGLVEGFEHDAMGWQWRFGEKPMGIGAGERVPDRAVRAGRHMLDDPYTVFEGDKWRVEP